MRIRFVASCVAAFVPSTVSAQTGTPMDAADLVRAAVTASAANRHSFSSYSCRYRVTKASARSVEDAIARRWINAKACEFRYALDGAYEIQESFGPTAAELASIKDTRPFVAGYKYVNADFDRAGYLRNGNLEIGHIPELRTASLTSPDRPHRVRVGTLLDFGVMGARFENAPEKLLENAATFDFVPGGPDTVGGIPVVTAEFHGKAARPGEDYRFSLDPGRGYLAVKASFTNKTLNKMPKSRRTGPILEVFLLAARECSARRWYPERWVMVAYPDVPGRELIVWDYELLEFDADHRPDHSTFTRELPAGTGVKDYTHPLKQFVTKKVERINVDDLSRIEQMIKDAPEFGSEVPDAMRKDTAITPTGRYIWPRRLGIGAGVGLAAWGIYALLRRRRSV